MPMKMREQLDAAYRQECVLLGAGDPAVSANGFVPQNRGPNHSEIIPFSCFNSFITLLPFTFLCLLCSEEERCYSVLPLHKKFAQGNSETGSISLSAIKIWNTKFAFSITLTILQKYCSISSVELSCFIEYRQTSHALCQGCIYK